LSPDSDLTKDIRNAKSIQIVSAFCNHDFFAMVCSLAKKSAQTEIIIPRERGMRGADKRARGHFAITWEHYIFTALAGKSRWKAAPY
jgi:predicted transcriptional regulator